MAVAIFVELYIEVSCSGRSGGGLVCSPLTVPWLYFRLMTALLIASAYAAGTGSISVVEASGWRGLSVVTALACALLVGCLIVLPDSESALSWTTRQRRHSGLAGSTFGQQAPEACRRETGVGLGDTGPCGSRMTQALKL